MHNGFYVGFDVVSNTAILVIIINNRISATYDVMKYNYASGWIFFGINFRFLLCRRRCIACVACMFAWNVTSVRQIWHFWMSDEFYSTSVYGSDPRDPVKIV